MAESSGKSNDLKQTNVGGLRAVELNYRGIREIASGNTRFLQSQTRLNTPELGTMMPENFRDVAEMSTQAEALFELELGQAIDAHQKFNERDFFFHWLSVYMPVRFLKAKRSESRLLQLFEERELATNRICFELPDSILLETDGKAAKVIANLRNRGFHFMLSNFGGDNCPLMKLSEFPVDFVMLSPEVTNYLEKSERSGAAVHSIVRFVNDMGAEPIADMVSNARQAEMFYEFECSYVAGSLSGKYTAERYVRNKTDAIISEE